MRAVHTFTVATQLPPKLQPLQEIAFNLGWLSDERVQDLFRRVSSLRWEADGLDALGYLARTPQSRLDELAADDEYCAAAADLLDDLRRADSKPRWFQSDDRAPLELVAYFSPEFGIAEGLPQYSGGLGVLAGDHMKAASDLGVPIVGVGLFYHHGYFSQTLDERGWQVERFPRLHPQQMALRRVEHIDVSVELAERTVHLAVWEAAVGRLQLFLLDSALERNHPDDRLVTDRLYGGGPEQRIRQEIVLGVGGVRMLRALDLFPQVFHLNEGHAAFLALERIREEVGRGLSLDEAIEATRPAQVFTTHTPVPAGIDRFDRGLVERYFSTWAKACGTSIDRLMEIGHEPGTPFGEQLNLAVLALRLSCTANGVSALHRDVSRQMFQGVWPDIPLAEIPIGGVTNGVHVRSWVSREIADLYERTIGSDWPTAEPPRWSAIEEVPDETIWGIRRTARQRLVEYARRQVLEGARRRGRRESELAWVEEMLDPSALTIGFARRFAPYKRATLLLRDPDRLRALLLSEERPVQLIFAGKAHPADDPGKEHLRRIVEMASDLSVRHRLVFLEDFGIGIARVLHHGVDVWLNTPRRPLEACGTSGMKAAVNGALNCSILDGWWDELYDSEAGWAIPSFEWFDDDDARDGAESAALFSLLEREIVPLFYGRADDGVPHEWVKRSKVTMARIGPLVTASRMVRDYVVDYYGPAARRSARLNGDDAKLARELAAWKQRVVRAWDAVAVVSVEHDDRPVEVGEPRTVESHVRLGPLDPGDIVVELLHGPVDLDDRISEPASTELTCAGSTDTPGTWRYTGALVSEIAGSYGFTVRVSPRHHDLACGTELGRMVWAPDAVDMAP
jgi:starch phosphorylase